MGTEHMKKHVSLDFFSRPLVVIFTNKERPWKKRLQISVADVLTQILVIDCSVKNRQWIWQRELWNKWEGLKWGKGIGNGKRKYIKFARSLLIMVLHWQ